MGRREGGGGQEGERKDEEKEGSGRGTGVLIIMQGGSHMRRGIAANWCCLLMCRACVYVVFDLERLFDDTQRHPTHPGPARTYIVVLQQFLLVERCIQNPRSHC